MTFGEGGVFAVVAQSRFSAAGTGCFNGGAGITGGGSAELHSRASSAFRSGILASEATFCLAI